MPDHEVPRISIICTHCGTERVIQESSGGNNLRYYEANRNECQHCTENKNVQTTSSLADL